MANKKSQKREKKHKKRSSTKKKNSSIKGGSCNCGKNLFFKPMMGGFVDDGKHYVEQPSFAGGIHPPSYYSLNNYIADPQDPSILHDARLDPMKNTVFGGDRKKEKKSKSSKKKGGYRRRTIKGGVIQSGVATHLNSANFPSIGVNAISANGNVSGAVLGSNTLLGVPSTYQDLYPINSDTTVKHYLV
jgi:hypothetical protein